MVFMWVKVLINRRPSSAEANLTPPSDAVGAPAPSRVQVSFIELPRIPGRHDTIKRDFFDPAGWRGFRKDGDTRGSGAVSEVDLGLLHDRDQSATLLAGKLKLEAVVLSKTPQAFINDTLLPVGGRSHVTVGGTSYEFEVVRIQESTVVVDCGGRHMTLKLEESHQPKG